MTTLREAAQQALEALEFLSLDFMMLDLISPGREASYKAISALRAALAEPVQEPVAWIDDSGHPKHIRHLQSVTERRLYGPLRPLYTAPPQRKPLTEEEIGKVAAPYYGTMGFRVEAFARAIERAHGIGGQNE